MSVHPMPPNTRAIVTREHGFSDLDAGSDPPVKMLAVRPGLPAAQALEEASAILDSCGGVIRSLMAQAESPDDAVDARQLYALERLHETAKALIDSVEGLRTR